MAKEINLTRVRINNEEVYVACDSTCFAGLRNIDTNIEIDNVLALYKEVIALAKSKGCKISYRNRYKHKLSENKERYNHDKQYFARLYQTFKDGWIEKVNKGIFYPYVEDEELKRLNRIGYKAEELLWAVKPISLVFDINKTLKELYSNLSQDDSQGSMLYL